MATKTATKRPRKLTRRIILREWVKDLESGKYRQVREELHGRSLSGKTAHCCLGVACETLARLGCEKAVQDKNKRRLLGSYGQYPDCLHREFPRLDNLRYNGTRESAVHLNDSVGLSFRQIAKVLRDNYPHVFGRRKKAKR